MTTVAVVGATGRFGTQIVRVVEAMDGFEIIARLNSKSDLAEMDGADLVIDASRHDVSNAVLDRAVSNGQRILIGTSGWSAAALEAKNLPATAAVTVIPNFSIGSMVATHVSAIVARYIPNARIDETHHVSKVDSPSGTSTHTAEVIAAARAETPNQPATTPNQPATTPNQPATAARTAEPNQPATTASDHIVAGVPITSHRLPDAIAEQLVTFTGNGETVTIRHETLSRDSYDSGIAAAIRFAATSAGVTVGLDRVMGIQ
jgi:4-hydroxy-tetrahydrodipicolinate reductase